MSILLAGLLALSLRDSGMDEIQRLAREGDLYGVVPLLRYLTDPDVSLRRPASDGIDSIIHRWQAQQAQSGYSHDHQAAEAALSGFGSKNLESIAWGPGRVRTLNDANSRDSKVRAALIYDRTYPFPQFELPDDVVVSHCGESMAQEWESDWPYLVQHCKAEINALLDDPTSDRRYDLLLELGPMRDRDLYLRLDGLCLMPQTVLRSHAYEAYQYYPGPHSVEQLIEGTKDRSAEVRCRSLWALSKVDPDRAALTAIGMLDQPVTSEQDFVADIAGCAKSESLIDKLASLLRSDDRRRRDAAENGLVNIGTRRSVDLVTALIRDHSQPDRESALFCLSRAPEPLSFDTVMDSLSDPDPGMVVTACHVLCYVKDDRSLPKLLELSKSANKEIRAAALSTVSFLAPKLPPP